MPSSIEFNFSHVFEGIVWNTIASSENGILFLEVRNNEQKRVTFSALDIKTGEFLWRDVLFDEPWWISLSASSGEFLIFTIYLETNNPDKKGVFAYHIDKRKIVWWNNDFSITSLADGQVFGVTSKYGTRSIVLDLASGREIGAGENTVKMNDAVIRPHQYLDDNEYFATVKTFLSRKFNFTPVIALEYMEHDSIIFISFYIQDAELANYLLIVSADGEELMKEKLDEHLKGIGMDTFFVLSGCVFFVKNKVELFSYKIV